MLSIFSRNMEEEKQTGARRRMKSMCAFALVGLKHIHSPNIVERRQVCNTFSLFIFLLFLPLFGFSATSQDVIDKCDVIDNLTRQVSSDINSAEHNITSFFYTFNDSDGSTKTITYMDSSDLRLAVSTLQNQAQRINFLSQQVGLIRQLATQLTSGGSYDDSDLMEELEAIHEEITSINNSLGDVKELVMDFMGWFTENQDKITDYFDNWGNFTNSLPSNAFYNYFTNRVTSTSGSQRNQINGFPFYFYNFSTGKFSTAPVFTTSWGHYNPYLNDSNSIDISKIKNLPDLFSLLHFDLTYGFNGIGNNLFTNTVDTIHYHKQSLQLLSDGFSAVSNSTVRPYIDELYKSPLDDVTSDFYSHLTNSYLSAYSGTNPNTNWFRRVETLLAALVFQGSGHEEDIEEVGEAADKAESDRSTLEGTFDAENVLSFDLGQQILDTNFHLPSMGSQFPQTLSFTVPNYGGSGSQSEDYTITIDTTKIRPLCELIRACFRMLYLLFLIFILWAIYKLFIKYLRFIFNLFSGLNA